MICNTDICLFCSDILLHDCFTDLTCKKNNLSMYSIAVEPTVYGQSHSCIAYYLLTNPIAVETTMYGQPHCCRAHYLLAIKLL